MHNIKRKRLKKDTNIFGFFLCNLCIFEFFSSIIFLQNEYADATEINIKMKLKNSISQIVVLYQITFGKVTANFKMKLILNKQMSNAIFNQNIWFGNICRFIPFPCFNNVSMIAARLSLVININNFC